MQRVDQRSPLRWRNVCTAPAPCIDQADPLRQASDVRGSPALPAMQVDRAGGTDSWLGVAVQEQSDPYRERP